MTLNSIKMALTSTGIPVSYRSFSNPVTTPYAVYYGSRSDPIASDDKTVGRWGSFRVELYTNGKDTESESKVDTALNGITPQFYKEEVSVDNDLLMITYDLEGVE